MLGFVRRHVCPKSSILVLAVFSIHLVLFVGIVSQQYDIMEWKHCFSAHFWRRLALKRPLHLCASFFNSLWQFVLCGMAVKNEDTPSEFAKND